MFLSFVNTDKVKECFYIKETGKKRQTEAAAHSERSLIKICFPGLGWFLLSRQHYRHSEETFSMAMCKTVYEGKQAHSHLLWL